MKFASADERATHYATHAALIRAGHWTTLKLVGRQYLPADGDHPEETLELRNCPCGATLARRVPTR